jgi:hypothetical protein
VPNLFFDSLNPVVELSHGERRLQSNFTPVSDSGKRYWDGWMGIDALGGGFLLDFQAMRFTVD